MKYMLLRSLRNGTGTVTELRFNIHQCKLSWFKKRHGPACIFVDALQFGFLSESQLDFQLHFDLDSETVVLVFEQSVGWKLKLTLDSESSFLDVVRITIKSWAFSRLDTELLWASDWRIFEFHSPKTVDFGQHDVIVSLSKTLGTRDIPS